MSVPNFHIEAALTRLRTIEPDPRKAAAWIAAATTLAAAGARSEQVQILANMAARGQLMADDLAQLSRHGIDITPTLDAIRRQAQ